MKFETELEIIRNGLLSGDLDDAVSRLKKDIAETSSRQDEAGKLANSAFRQIEETLEGKAKPDNFLKGMTERQSFILFSDRRETEEILKLYRYVLWYSIDRYNVRYPKYDGKRCGDK